MKLLVVAHPDDEILWFDPSAYDRILIVHTHRRDDPGQGERRAAMLTENHPLRDKLICLGLTESGYWRDSSRAAEHKANYTLLCEYLRGISPSEVTTHNAWGEYGHSDHIMVHNACMDALTCPVNGKDPALYRAIRSAYTDAGCWTWY